MSCGHNNYRSGCTRCRAQSAAAAQRRRDAIREGRHRPQVPAEHVRPHLEQLRAAGMAITVIAARAGISRHTVQHVPNGNRQYVVGVIADALLAVQPERLCRATGVPATGTTRRLQALAVEG